MGGVNHKRLRAQFARYGLTYLHGAEFDRVARGGMSVPGSNASRVVEQERKRTAKKSGR